MTESNGHLALGKGRKVAVLRMAKNNHSSKTIRYPEVKY